MDAFPSQRKVRYYLLCTECRQSFTPATFRGQIPEFRMCRDCQKENPEIFNYVDKYMAKPQSQGTWRPFRERVDSAAQMVAELEAEVAAFRQSAAVESEPIDNQNTQKTEQDELPCKKAAKKRKKD